MIDANGATYYDIDRKGGEKGFNLVLVATLFDAENRLAEDTEIEFFP